MTPPPVLARLESAWDRSDRIFSILKPESLLERPIALRHPFIFYVGHLPAFGWNQIGRGVLKRASIRPEFDDLFERGIDPLSEADPAARKRIEWPAVKDILEYRDRVRAALRDAHAEVAARHDERLYHVVLEHELMHHETLLYMMQQLDRGKRTRPDGVPSPVGGGGERRLEKPVRVPEGDALLGAEFSREPFGWDNEFPEHRVRVPAFEIDRIPVTNARYREFVDDGGYGDRALWSEGGWAAKEKYALKRPSFWKDRGKDGELVVETLFEDVPFEVAEHWPVTVSWIEADAYARWRGARLMTEAEFHRAGFGTPDGERRARPWGDAPLDARRANVDFANWAPTPVGSHPAGVSAFGVEDLVGDGWEWTGTPFAPFPGFRAWIESYPGYSADFFDGKHFVLLGGSWATASDLVRRSFRNWFQPNYPYVFAKFRCVRPV